MKETRKAKAAADVAEIADVEKDPPVRSDPPAKRRHLEGWGYYLVYVPAIIVSTCLALLFVDAVDDYLYGDD